MKRCVRALLAVALLFPQLVCVVGLMVYPMQQVVRPGESAVYTTSNQTDSAVAVEVIPEKWLIHEDGTEERVPTDELVAYPSQFILKGHTYKKIKVGPRDSANLDTDRELSYRVTIRELPISLEPEKPGTYRIYHASGYRTSFYIRPSSTEPQVELAKAAMVGQKLALRFQNSGTHHAHLRNPSLKVLDGNGREIAQLPIEALKSINGQNMHAGIARDFEIDLSDVELPPEAARVRLHFEDGGHLESEVYEIPIRQE